MYIIIWILISSAAVVPGCASESCSTLEKTAAGSSPPSDSQLTSGTFALTSAPLLCAGTATQWRVCYYKSTSNTQSTTSLGVYRRSTTSSMTLNPVSGLNVGYITVEGTSSYSCSNITVPTPFKVMPGDVIVVCVLSETSSMRLGAAVVLPRASVLHNQEPCTTLPSSIDVTKFVRRSGLTVLVSLDVIGCGTNGYFLDSNATNCSYTSMLSPVNQDTSTTLKHERQQETAAIAASVVIIAILVGVTVTVVVVVTIHQIRRRKNSQATGTAPLDNMVYQTPMNSNTIVRSSGVTQDQGSEQMYQVIETDTNIYATLCQQVSYDVAQEYEDPYCLPSLHEEELYAQLENHKIQKIPRQEIRTTMALGKGQFGDVEIGIWTYNGRIKEVAVKTLNLSSTKLEDKIKFLQEAAIMAQFKHPNVIQLYGIVTDGEPIILVLELAHNKDLKTHVSSLRPRAVVRSDLPKILLAYSKQVALGMQYLSSKSFVHCDLAARNVLVTKDYVCKIADFGLSHNLANESYYITHGGVIPIKWTAPEAINFKKYSTASDVWSYGCLLYEIWTLGFKPFEGLSNAEAVEKLEAGYRLPPPPGCPRMIYQLMINCWNPEAHNRPGFKDVYTLLSSHESDVLVVPNEALLSHSQAGHLGAPLEAGEGLYLDLQKIYT